mmetsp:Transcript_11458/g.9871  ORF Transcript_11458/g.9871 Transcript_11458/m.9871 type:complete len:147 (+) Transcript_11458:1352-1792(+)
MEWAARFSALVTRYQSTIRGLYYGHTHEEGMALMRSFEDPTVTVGVMLMPGSLTAYNGRTPGFRIFTVDEETKLPIDYDQYRLNVSKWNEVHEGQIEWEIVYTFLDEYSLEDMSLKSIDAMVDRFVDDNDLVNTFQLNIHTGTWKY